jgi:hypothetical protein
MSVQSLVAAAQQPAVDVSGLWDTYNGMVSRSRSERNRLRQELEAMGDGALIDAFDMFKLPEAYGSDRYPLVAVALISAALVRFHYDGWHAKFVSGSLDLSVASPPPAPVPEPMKYTTQDGNTYSLPPSYSSVYQGFSGSVGVPLVPKAIAPRFWSAKRLLGKCWIMFDTPTWSDKKVLPVDPYLLERVDEKRFRVLAHWDLTDKERQLMALIRP